MNKKDWIKMWEEWNKKDRPMFLPAYSMVSNPETQCLIKLELQRKLLDKTKKEIAKIESSNFLLKRIRLKKLLAERDEITKTIKQLEHGSTEI